MQTMPVDPHTLPVTANCRFCEEEFVYIPVSRRQSFKGAPRNFKGRGYTVRNVCDKCREDRKRPARIVKYGLQAKDWPAMRDIPQWRARVDNAYFIHQSLQIIQPNPMRGIMGSDWEQGWAMADGECEHGRRPGDPCPSPLVTFTSREFKGRVVQNWPHDYPCGCWKE